MIVGRRRPGARGRASGLKKNKKKMMLFRRSNAKARFFHAGSRRCPSRNRRHGGRLRRWCDPANRELPMKVTSFAAISLLMVSAAFAAEKPSQAFLKKAIQGNYAEVQMGQLAQKQGQNDGVKKFGQMLSDDHSAANQKAIDAAKSMGVTPPDGPSATQKADYDKMSKMTGPQFDRQFATHMVADHQRDIAEYKKEAKQSDAAGEYAKGQIDALQKHLDTAKSLKSSKTSSR
jgi:putative membrane protein